MESWWKQKLFAWLPWWSLMVQLAGILFYSYSLTRMVFVIWWELLIFMGIGLLRTASALEHKAWYVGLVPRIGWTLAGLITGFVFFLLTVTFSFKAFTVGNSDALGLAGMRQQVFVMALGQVLWLVQHYYLTGKYVTASPSGEVMRMVIYLMIFLAPTMVLTMHLIPALPQLPQGMSVGIAVLVVKFLVDRYFVK